MPIRGEYTWTEARDSLKIIIPLKGVSPKIVDIFITGSLLKVNYFPYLLEIYLFKEVDAIRHKATVKDGILQILLQKKTIEIWGKLEMTFEEYEKEQLKVQLQKKRQEAYEERTALEQKIASEAGERKITEERHAVRQQMALEEEVRNRMEQLKAEEKKAAEEEVYKAFAQLQSTTNPGSSSSSCSSSTAATVTAKKEKLSSTVESIRSDTKKLIHEDVLLQSYDMIDDMEEDEVLSPNKKKVTPLTQIAEGKDEEDANDDDNDDDEEREVDNNQAVDEREDEVIEREEDDIKYIPPPRQSTTTGDSKVKINFTPRLFPTPMRESKAAEEEDWIAKNRRHLKKHGVLGKQAKKGDVSEEDPVWLKAKGDDFFRSGDIRSALNAYSAAIDAYDINLSIFTTTTSSSSAASLLPQLDANLIACISNRSLCYLKLNLSQDCKIDCDIVLKSYSQELEQLISKQPPLASSSTPSDGVTDPSDPIQTSRMKLTMNIIKLLLRRGLVSCQLGKYADSLSDYTQAQGKIQTLTSYYLQQLTSSYHITMESIEQDIQRLKIIHTAESHKKKGDVYFSEKMIDLAIEQYSQAIQFIPIYVSAYSNRSACYLLQSNFMKSIYDCNMALEILQLSDEQVLPKNSSKGGGGGGGGVSVINFSTKTISPSSYSSSSLIGGNFHFIRTMLHAIVPLPNTEKQKQWIMNISLKKAVAFIQQDQYDEAITIYEQMILLDTTNETIRNDLKNLKLKQQQKIIEQEQLREQETVQSQQQQQPEEEEHEGKENINLVEISSLSLRKDGKEELEEKPETITDLEDVE